MYILIIPCTCIVRVFAVHTLSNLSILTARTRLVQLAPQFDGSSGDSCKRADVGEHVFQVPDVGLTSWAHWLEFCNQKPTTPTRNPFQRFTHPHVVPWVIKICQAIPIDSQVSTGTSKGMTPPAPGSPQVITEPSSWSHGWAVTSSQGFCMTWSYIRSI